MNDGTPTSAPVFLSVEPGSFVVVKEGLPSKEEFKGDWWIGQVIHIQGGARELGVNSIFQIANIDTGVILWVNANLVIRVLKY